MHGGDGYARMALEMPFRIRTALQIKHVLKDDGVIQFDSVRRCNMLNSRHKTLGHKEYARPGKRRV